MNPKNIYAELNGQIFTERQLRDKIGELGFKYRKFISSDATVSDIIQFLKDNHWLRHTNSRSIAICIPA
jgi:hypothetical protein